MHESTHCNCNCASQVKLHNWFRAFQATVGPPLIVGYKCLEHCLVSAFCIFVRSPGGAASSTSLPRLRQRCTCGSQCTAATDNALALPLSADECMGSWGMVSWSHGTSTHLTIRGQIWSADFAVLGATVPAMSLKNGLHTSTGITKEGNIPYDTSFRHKQS